MWGGGDFASFAASPDENSYDGSLAAMYLGMDGRGDGWVAGGAVGQVKADASYEYKDGQVSGKGKLDTSLTTLHPYVGWALTEQAKAWVIVGFGTGEASMTRDGASYVAEPTDLSMRMGLVGASGTLGEPGGFDIALRADAGAVALETGTGPKAIDELSVSVQRARLGFEMSYTANTGPVVGGVRLSGAGGNAGAVTPFVEVAARLDSGDGPSGTGAEVAAGVRYQSSTVNFEAKARTLAMHGAGGLLRDRRERHPGGGTERQPRPAAVRLSALGRRPRPPTSFSAATTPRRWPGEAVPNAPTRPMTSGA